jgi:hypothetical protein
VAFCEEERFSRRKHAVGAFPVAAAQYCLQEAGIGIEDVNFIAVGWEARKFPANCGVPSEAVAPGPCSMRLMATGRNPNCHGPRIWADRIC